MGDQEDGKEEFRWLENLTKEKIVGKTWRRNDDHRKKDRWKEARRIKIKAKDKALSGRDEDGNVQTESMKNKYSRQ